MEESVDRISGLPEGILHHILSFVLTKDAIRAAATCKRLKQIWTTLPYLDLGRNFFPPVLPPESYSAVSGEAMKEVDAMAVDAEDDEELVAEEDDEELVAEEDDEELVAEEDEEEIDTEEEEEIEYVSASESESEEEDYEGNAIKREKLFTFVEQTLSGKIKQDITLQKFRIGMRNLDAEISKYLDRWIGYLVDCNIKEFDFRVTFGNYHLPEEWYKLPSMLLSTASLHSLSLHRCRVPCGTIINLPSLRKLQLEWVYLDEQILKDIINTCCNLEYLCLSYCPGLRKINVSGLPHLKVLTFNPLSGGFGVVDEVFIETQNVEQLTYSGGNLPFTVNIITNFEGCLKSLHLYGAVITNARFCELISRLPRLEELFLAELDLKSIEISSSSVKRLVLSRVFRSYQSDGIGEITVNAPNLLNLKYYGCLTYRFPVTLAVKEVFLALDDVRAIPPPRDLCSKLMQFLSIFDYSQVVKLDCTFFENMIFPVEKRSNLLAPLAHVEHLVLQGRFQTYPLCSLEKLLDSLLWVCPSMVSLSLKDKFWNDTERFFPIDLSMKIPAGQCGGSTISRRCLRDCRLHAKIESDDVAVADVVADDDAEVCKFLSGFFTPDVQVQLKCSP